MNFKHLQVYDLDYHYKDIGNFTIELAQDIHDPEKWYVSCGKPVFVCVEAVIFADSYKKAKIVALHKVQEMATKKRGMLQLLILDITELLKPSEV